MPHPDPMPASLSIRLATPADALELARLRYEFRTTLDVPTETADAFLARCTPWMSDRLRPAAAWRCWVAEASAALIGAVWLHFLEKIPNPAGEPEGHGYITNLYVRPDHRGSAVGGRLIAAALQECDRRGLHSVLLWPTPRSRTLYERHGFGVPRTLLERPAVGELHGHARSAV
jgi:GNAT superfamily N-acetyltransferase